MAFPRHAVADVADGHGLAVAAGRQTCHRRRPGISLGFQHGVDLGVVLVEVGAQDRVRGLPLGEVIVGRVIG